jgi:hypothetical protein
VESSRVWGAFRAVVMDTAASTIQRGSLVPYRIENLGAAFNDRAIAALSQKLNAFEGEGWNFDSVFMIQHKTCLGLSTTNSYLAVFHKD